MTKRKRQRKRAAEKMIGVVERGAGSSFRFLFQNFSLNLQRYIYVYILFFVHFGLIALNCCYYMHKIDQLNLLHNNNNNNNKKHFKIFTFFFVALNQPNSNK
jgi:hypothetical protein